MGAVTVVGAGLAGLSAACHLAGAGHEVTVLERGTGPGGRAGVLELDGFRFDTGPTVLTMVDLIDRVTRAAGTPLRDLVSLQRLDPAYRARFSDGSTIRVRAGVEAMTQEIRDTCGPADAAAFTDFARWLQRLYEVELPHFIDARMDSLGDLLSHPAAMAELVRMGAFRKLGDVVGSRFRDTRLHRLFSFQAMYAGLPPRDALALYAVITHMDCIEGVWAVQGGIHAVAQALETAARTAGAEFRYGAEVEEVLRRRDGAVAGVGAAGETTRADAVVLTVDLPEAYRSLLPELQPPRRLRKARYSPSCVVWHAGVRGLPKDPAHHSIHFGDAWDASFEALINEGRLMPDPSRMVGVGSLSDPGLAPDGCSTLYVLEPVPHLGHRQPIDWAREAGPMRDRLHAFLEAEGYPTDVVVERMVTPLDWERDGMRHGTPFSLAHTFRQTGPFRPSAVETRVPGVFFAGTGTTPGVGVPMVLISGELAATRVGRYL